MTEVKQLINAFVTHMKEIGWDIVLNEKQDNDIPKNVDRQIRQYPAGVAGICQKRKAHGKP